MTKAQIIFNYYYYFFALERIHNGHYSQLGKDHKKLCIPFSNCCDWISVLHKMKVMCMFLTKQAPAN